jgi:hypothetical protein
MGGDEILGEHREGDQQYQDGDETGHDGLLLS